MRSVPGLMLATLAALPLDAQQAASQPPPIDTQRVLEDVGIDQRLGERVDLSLRFRNHRGEDVALGDLFGERPVLLVLAYWECPMLCTLVLNDVVECLRALPLRVGEDFELVAVSIDPHEAPELAAAKRAAYLEEYDADLDDPERDGAGWSFLVGDEDAVAALAEDVGFRYAYDPATDEYAHAAGIQLLTPDGELSRYFYGLEYPPRDVRLGLVEASKGTIGTAVDQVLLFCYHYDPATGKYGLVVMNVVRLGGALTVVVLVGFIGVMLLRERRRAPRAVEVNG